MIEQSNEQVFVCKGSTSASYTLPFDPSGHWTCQVVNNGGLYTLTLEAVPLLAFVPRDDPWRKETIYRSIRVESPKKLVLHEDTFTAHWASRKVTLRWPQSQVAWTRGRVYFKVIFSTTAHDIAWDKHTRAVFERLLLLEERDTFFQTTATQVQLLEEAAQADLDSIINAVQGLTVENRSLDKWPKSTQTRSFDRVLSERVQSRNQTVKLLLESKNNKTIQFRFSDENDNEDEDDIDDQRYDTVNVDHHRDQLGHKEQQDVVQCGQSSSVGSCSKNNSGLEASEEVLCRYERFATLIRAQREQHDIKGKGISNESAKTIDSNRNTDNNNISISNGKSEVSNNNSDKNDKSNSNGIDKRVNGHAKKPRNAVINGSIDHNNQSEPPTLAGPTTTITTTEATFTPTTITIKGCTRATFRSLLFFLYTGEVELKTDSAFSEGDPDELEDGVSWVELYTAAEKYGITDLRDLCRSRIIGSLRTTNAVDILFTVGLRCEEVKHAASELIIQDFDLLLGGDDDGNSFEQYYGKKECVLIIQDLMRETARRLRATLSTTTKTTATTPTQAKAKEVQR